MTFNTDRHERLCVKLLTALAQQRATQKGYTGAKIRCPISQSVDGKEIECGFGVSVNNLSRPVGRLLKPVYRPNGEDVLSTCSTGICLSRTIENMNITSDYY